MHPKRLKPEHAPIYRALMLHAYEAHPDAFTSSAAERAALPMAWWVQRLDARLDANELVFGTFRGTELTGVVGLTFETREKTRHKSKLIGMYVAPDFRGQGLGGQLVQTALSYARSRPVTKVLQLTVTEGNSAAQALYAQHGFVTFGVEPLAVALGDAYVSKIHMWRALE